MLALLAHAGRVDADVADALAASIAIPVPRLFAAEGAALAQMLRDPLAHSNRRPLDGRFAQADPGRLLQQIGPFLETVGDRSAQRRDPLNGG